MKDWDKELEKEIEAYKNWKDKFGGFSRDMPLRDYFAAAFVSSGHVFKSDTPVNTAERVAAQAYQLADAMLEARK